jgi:hypothetical protein
MFKGRGLQSALLIVSGNRKAEAKSCQDLKGNNFRKRQRNVKKHMNHTKITKFLRRVRFWVTIFPL